MAYLAIALKVIASLVVATSTNDISTLFYTRALLKSRDIFSRKETLLQMLFNALLAVFVIAVIWL